MRAEPPHHHPPRRPSRHPWILAILGLWLAACPAARPQAPVPEDRIPFEAALRSLQAGFRAPAAEAFAAFVKARPDSPLVPEATLWEARARAELGQHEAAIAVLQSRLERLATLRDQGLILLGDLHLARSEYPSAAAAYRRLTVELPASSRLLQAAFGEALAQFRAGHLAATRALLAGTTNAFARASAALPNDETTVRGRLLLAETELRSGSAAAAAANLDQLTNRPLAPRLAWERQLLVASLLRTNRQPEAALHAASNLVHLAAATGSRDVVSRSHALLGEYLAAAGRVPAAFAAFTNNLADATPSPWRRDALLALSSLPLDASLLEPALALLSPLAASLTNDPAFDAARLAVAELRLQHHFAAPPPPPSAGRLLEIRPLLAGILTNQPAPILAGRAWYGLGWIDLASGLVPAAADAFARAATNLPSSALRAFALFKLADCQAAVTNHGAALTNYLRVIREFADTPGVRGGVLERALYQGALSALEVRKDALANELAERAVVEFPAGELRDDTRVLYGQTLARLDSPGRARDVIQQLARRLVGSPALPVIQLTLARSYMADASWTNALQLLDDWTRVNTNHPSLARAEFERAWAAFKGGNDPHAFGVFTNFLVRFPGDPAAPQAQSWVADHLFRTGQFAAAEAAYQLIYQRTNWPITRLTHEARLMAGKAAFARQGYRDAKPYFRWLIENGPPAVSNSTVPPEFVARAYFAFGDCLLQEPESDDKERDAITAFATVIDKFPDTREALLARGKLANCYLARAELDPAQAASAYTNAAAIFLAFANNKSIEVNLRSQAEVGLALVREKQALRVAGEERDSLLQQALGHHLNVFHGGNLAPGESPSPFWFNRSGSEAARLAEFMGLPGQAANLYDTLARAFPSSAVLFQQRAAQLRTPAP